MRKLFGRRRDETGDANPHSSIDSSISHEIVSEESYGLFSLANDASEDYDIDIVAVHGLDGHWAETWTDTSGDRKSLWLRDFLPSQLQEEASVCARVMSYGYDSTTVFSKSVSDIEDQAGALLHALNMERISATQKKKPIIFVAHSLGGIIVKKALIVAHERSSLYGSLLNSVSGMVLFGVPHRGSDVAYWANFAANVLNASQLGANANFVRSLQKNSNAFSDISHQFIERAANLRKIYTFYELEKLHNILVVDKDSARLAIRNEVPVAVSANHREICKFHSADSRKYRPVWKAIQLLCLEVKGDEPSHKPAAHFLLRFERDEHFVGREDILEQISLKFKTQKRVALDGIGGVGKSQIAIEYCYRAKKEHPQSHIFWVHAGSVGRFEQAYKSIAKKCNIPGWDHPGANALQLVYEWLSDERNGSWLMILDNADDKSVFLNQKGENASQEVDRKDDVPNLLCYLPQSSQGLILITSRNRDAAYRLTYSVENIIDVPLMNAELALSLLSKKIPKTQQDLELGLELVDLLDRLPLAITQACAFIAVRKLSLSDYMKYFRENTNILLEDVGDIRRDPTMLHSVILTWHISFNQIRKENNPAAKLLSLMSVLERQDIPRSMISRGHSDFGFDNAVAPLLDFSLISQGEDRKAFGMHRLVQIATRTWLEKHNERTLWEATAVALLAKAFPNGDYDTWETCSSLLPHTNIVTDYQYSSPEAKLQLATLLVRRAVYLYRNGKFRLAKQDVQRCLGLRLGLLGRESVPVMVAMNLKALILSSDGDYLTAESLYRESLLIAQKIGMDENEAQTIRVNLGMCLGSRNEPEEAVHMFQPVYESRRKALGQSHPQTLDAMEKLALGLSHQKKFDEAKTLCQQLLDTLMETQGEQAPVTIKIMGTTMADILNRSGSSERAEEMCRRASELAKKEFGRDHNHTQAILSRLQDSLRANGKYDEAEDLGRHLLNLDERTLGQSHRDTLITVHNLAGVLESQGKYDESESLRHRALSDGERYLGQEHVDTILFRHRLIAGLKTYYRKHEEAEQMLQALEAEGNQEEADTIRLDIEYCKHRRLTAERDA